MKIIGFNLTKIAAEKKSNFKSSKINPNIDFLNIEKDKAELLKDSEIVKVTFKHDLNYKNSEAEKDEQGYIKFEGVILISLSLDESKKILKSWKKKELSNDLKLSLSNLVLRKCSSKALQLQDELNLPTHLPLPVLDKKN